MASSSIDKAIIGQRILSYYKQALETIRSDVDIWAICKQHQQQINGLVYNNTLLHHLDNFTTSPISNVTNCSDYVAYKDTPELETHLNDHEKKFIDLTGLPLSILQIPDKFNHIGKKEGDKIIPATGYRIGYNASQILKLDTITDRKTIVLEIGAGWGYLANIITSNFKNVCYIIIDLPNVSILSAYFLLNLGKKVALYGEFTNIDQAMINEFDVIIMPPVEIEKIKDKFCDIVINTASLPEMGANTIEYYIKQIKRICGGYFYYDNLKNYQYSHFLQKYCDEILTDFDLIIKQETPINYSRPMLWNIPYLPFEERLYKLLPI